MYVNYHKHDDISNIILTDSVAKLEDYALRAVELGQTILSSCNHGTPGNYRQCYDLAKKYGLHGRYVAEVYFVKDRLAEDEGGLRDRKNCHMILAAKTEKGMYDLNEVISEAIELLGPDISIIHLKDYVLEGGQMNCLGCGLGEMDYERIVEFAVSKKPYIQATLENTKPENAVSCREYIEGLEKKYM